MGLFASGTITLGTRMAVFGLSLLGNVLLARALGPSGRGVYTLALLVPSLMVLLANLGLVNAIVFHVGKGLMTVTQVTREVLFLALALGAVAYAVQLVLMLTVGSRLVPGVPVRYVLAASACVPVVLAFNFLQAILQARQRFIGYNLIQVVNYAGVVILLIPLVFLLRLGTWGAVLAWTLSCIPTLLVCLALVRQTGAALGVGFTPAVSRALLGFGVVAYAGSLTSFLNLRLDVFIVNLFGSTRDVGIYSVGTGLAETIWYLATAAATVLAPRAAESTDGSLERVTAVASRLIVTISTLASAALALAAPKLIEVFFGSAFQDAALALWLLLPGVVALSSAKVLSTYLLGRNRMVVDFASAITGLVVTIALDLLLIPRYGFAGAAVASSLAYAAMLATSMTWIVRNSGLGVIQLLVIRPDDVRLLARKLRRP